MRPGTRTLLTLASLAVLLVVAAAWGLSAVTAPFPGKVDLPTCVDTALKKGDRVFPDQVVVSVFNAGTREGLAGLTMKQLTDAGFVAGDSGNAPHKARVRRVEVWSTGRNNPAAVLVASRFGPGTRVVKARGAALGAGVVVVVGDQFKAVVQGRKTVVARAATTICSPPATP
jgi:hypothetical protein